MRRRPAALKPSEWELRERVFTSSPTMEAAYHRREDLTELFARDDTKAGATGAMRAWCKRVWASGLAEFERVLGRRERGIDESTNHFQGRQTNHPQTTTHGLPTISGNGSHSVHPAMRLRRGSAGFRDIPCPSQPNPTQCACACG